MRFFLFFLGILIILISFLLKPSRIVFGQKIEESEMKEAHQQMVQTLVSYGIKNEEILKVMGKVKRHRFIPKEFLGRDDPYGDHPCPIGQGQTISQPYIVAYMTEKINPKPGEKVLEIGTGSGYQAAILAELGAKMFSIEIVPELASHATTVLASEGYSVQVLEGDGYKGWPQNAPFDAIIITCAPEDVPQTLVDQLGEGGRMILPVGGFGFQRLVILRKKDGKISTEEDLPVRFVPMVHGK